jgi:hypothetical protein
MYIKPIVSSCGQYVRTDIEPKYIDTIHSVLISKTQRDKPKDDKKEKKMNSILGLPQYSGES